MYLVHNALKLKLLKICAGPSKALNPLNDRISQQEN